MMHSSLGMRMKEYEKNPATDNGVNIIRLDGKAFHTWTKKTGMLRPFSNFVHECMTVATEALAEEMQGFKIAYTQSDEATLLMENLKDETEAWFGGKTQKIASVATSIFTYAFNKRYQRAVDQFNFPDIPAYFDARVHSIPVEDAANNFVWRQKDWERNSIQMMGQHYIGHSEMQGMSNAQIIEYFEKNDMAMFEVEPWKRFGTFLLKDSEGDLVRYNGYLDYEEVSHYARIANYIDWTK